MCAGGLVSRRWVVSGWVRLCVVGARLRTMIGVKEWRAFIYGRGSTTGAPSVTGSRSDEFHDGRDGQLRRYLVTSVILNEFHVVVGVGQQRCELGRVLHG